MAKTNPGPTPKPKPKSRHARARVMPTRYQQMMDAIDDGTFSLDMLDEQEILRGRLRNKDGDFRGRPSYMIPQKMATELVKRQQAIIQEKMGPLANASVEQLHRIVHGGVTTVHDGPLIQAIKLGLEYGLGKPIEKVQFQGTITVNAYDNVIEASTIPVDEEDGDI